MKVNSQSLLSETEHKEIDKIRWEPVEQQSIRLVDQFVRCDITPGIPQASLERIKFVHFSTFLENITPWLLAQRIASDVEDGNFGGPEINFELKLFSHTKVKLSLLFRRRNTFSDANESIDSKVNRNAFSAVSTIAQ